MWIQFIFVLTLLSAFFVTATAAWTDFKAFTIPNWISLAVLVLYPIAVFASPVPVDWLWSLAVFGTVFTVGFILFVVGALGGGDVKLLAALSLWAGLDGIGLFLIATALAGGVLVPVFVLRGALKSEESDRSFSGKIRSQFRAKLDIPYGIAIAIGSLPIFYQYAITAKLFG